ncbi:MAG: methylenetetrahydrofolate reductase [NAD(P)H] [Vampirovibrionales bacterium]
MHASTSSSHRCQVSFEFFPPSTPALQERLWQAIEKLAPLAPKFVSVTYGAGGSTRNRTHATIERLLQETSLTPAPHLTCVGSDKPTIEEIAHQYWDMGVRHLVALRGDIPQNQPPEEALKDYRYATDLLVHLRSLHPFELSVAAYPEGHPEASSLRADLAILKEKQALGATQAITQFFFEAETFLRFRDRAEASGITLPIIPGILPVMNVAQTASFAKKCGASLPARLIELFEGLDDDPDTRQLIATHEAIALCQTLRKEGVDTFHFYTLNRAELVYGICHALGLRKPLTNASQPVG